MINSVFQPRKRFGQHFLHDTLIIDKIIKTISPQKKETIVEIGPGKGALTIPLAKLAIKLHAIELDNDLSVILKKRFRNNKSLIIENKLISDKIGLFKFYSLLYFHSLPNQQ